MPPRWQSCGHNTRPRRRSRTISRIRQGRKSSISISTQTLRIRPPPRRWTTPSSCPRPTGLNQTNALSGSKCLEELTRLLSITCPRSRISHGRRAILITSFLQSSLRTSPLKERRTQSETSKPLWGLCRIRITEPTVRSPVSWPS